MAPRETPLANLLDHKSSEPRVTPLDLFALARKKWLAGERLDIGRLAAELEVSRATAFRWVGSRELLYGELLSQDFVEAFAAARAAARGTGTRYVAQVARYLMTLVLESAPLRSFIDRDRDFAMRVLLSSDSPVERRCVAAVEEALAEQVAAGEIAPAMDLHSLAYVIVRIAESFMYRDVITGERPDIEAAITAIRILVESRAEAAKKAPAPSTRRKKTQPRARRTPTGRRRSPAQR
ncbi:MAG: QsdR family transcriptional regulator [Polyangia bacterium]